MLIIPPPKVRKPHRPPKSVPMSPPPPGQPLVLHSASYDPNGLTVMLGFDRPINIDALNSGSVSLFDGDTYQEQFGGSGGGSLVDDSTVQIGLQLTGGYSDPGVLLDVTSDSGIVAVDDGGTWVGATDMGLPFG